MSRVSNIFWTSSSPAFSQACFTGVPSVDGPCMLLVRAGNNGFTKPDVTDPSELSLTLPAVAAVKKRVTWDPLHGVPSRNPLDSVFQVRFLMNQQRVLASAGTTPYIEAAAPDYDVIEKIVLSAAVQNDGPEPTVHREVAWESAEVVFYYDSTPEREDAREFYYLTALPRALSPQKLRTTIAGTPAAQEGPRLEQYVELSAPGLIGFQLVGVVSFRANDPSFASAPLGADDLRLKVGVFITPPL